MRRAVTAAMLALALVGLVTAPTFAHATISGGGTVPGQRTVLTMGVFSDATAPLIRVDITVPTEFRVIGEPVGDGWRVRVSGSTVQFTGGELPVGGVTFFRIPGTATTDGVAKFAFTTYAADGTSQRWDGPIDGERPAAFVAFGAATLEDALDTGRGGGVTLAVAAVVVLGAGVSFLVWRRRMT